MQTKPIYTYSGCLKDVDDSKQIRSYICKDMHISNHISFERETSNYVSTSTNKKIWIQSQICLSPSCNGGRRRKPSGGGDEFLKKKQYSVREQFYQHLPWHNEVPKTNGTTTVTIPKIINLNFASDMLHFI